MKIHKKTVVSTSVCLENWSNHDHLDLFEEFVEKLSYHVITRSSWIIIIVFQCDKATNVQQTNQSQRYLGSHAIQQHSRWLRLRSKCLSLEIGWGTWGTWMDMSSLTLSCLAGWRTLQPQKHFSTWVTNLSSTGQISFSTQVPDYSST